MIANQFRLRNVKIDQRTDSEAELLVRKGVITRRTDPLPLSGGRNALVQRLKFVVEAEHAAAAKDTAVRQIERDIAQREEQAAQNRERRSRSSRGSLPDRYRQ